MQKERSETLQPLEDREEGGIIEGGREREAKQINGEPKVTWEIVSRRRGDLLGHMLLMEQFR